jgi:protein-S-isoprenylcysteine O-methyltransferase Ste14
MDELTLKQIKRKLVILLPAALLIICLLFFLPAGSLYYWQAWVYIAEMFLPATAVMVYLLRHDPELLERRLRTKEKVKAQKWVIGLSYPAFFAAFMLPAFDFRYGWSHVPLSIQILSMVLILVGYLMFVRVLLVNRYLSRIVEVAEDQRVIDTGPYALVRHPMYTSITIIYLFTSLALGSWWGIPPMLFCVGVIMARAVNEEKLLQKELPGYAEYMQKTRYRIIPGVW